MVTRISARNIDGEFSSKERVGKKIVFTFGSNRPSRLLVFCKSIFFRRLLFFSFEISSHYELLLVKIIRVSELSNSPESNRNSTDRKCIATHYTRILFSPRTRRRRKKKESPPPVLKKFSRLPSSSYRA